MKVGKAKVWIISSRQPSRRNSITPSIGIEGPILVVMGTVAILAKGVTQSWIYKILEFIFPGEIHYDGDLISFRKSIVFQPLLANSLSRYNQKPGLQRNGVFKWRSKTASVEPVMVRMNHE